jgi:hypothetical protein
MPYAAGLGESENHVLWSRVVSDDNFVAFDWEIYPSPSMGDAYFGLYVNGRHVRTEFLPEGVATRVTLPIPSGTSSFSYCALRHGYSADGNFNVEDVARTIEEDGAGDQVTLEFDFVPEAMDDISDSGGLLSSWSFAGLDQETNCEPVHGYPTRGKLAANLSVDGSDATLELYSSGTLVASGTAAFPGTLSFSERNSSGLSGSVAVAAGAVDASGIEAYARWPKSMVVYRETTSPPAVEQGRVPFEGKNKVRWTDPDDLAYGIYYYMGVPLSDTAVLGTPTPVMGVNMESYPEPPTNLQYLSGDMSNTVLGFSGSSTAGATYRLYAQKTPTDIIKMDYPDNTAAAGATTMSVPLYGEPYGGFSGFSGFSGLSVFAMVRAVHPTTGKEDRNMEMVRLRYDQFGNALPYLPNAPQLMPTSISMSGLSVAVKASYSSINEEASPSQLRLFHRTEAGAYDWASPIGTGTLSTGVDGKARATLSGTLPSQGFYFVKVTAFTSLGGMSDPDDSGELMVWADAGLVAGISGFSAYRTRS